MATGSTGILRNSMQAMFTEVHAASLRSLALLRLPRRSHDPSPPNHNRLSGTRSPEGRQFNQG